MPILIVFFEGQTCEERKIERAEKKNRLIRKVCRNCDIALTRLLINFVLNNSEDVCLSRFV